MPLEHLRAARNDLSGPWVVIQTLPPGARIAIAFGAGVAPDHSVVVQLINRIGVELINRVAASHPRRIACHHYSRAWIVVELLPAGAVVSAAWRACVSPDAPVVMQLKEIVAHGRDRHRPRVVVQSLPAGTVITTARSSGVAPDPAIVV